MQTGPSYLAGFDKSTGDEVWKVDRNVPAPVEAAQSYSTPLVVQDAQGQPTIYVLGADHVTAHNGKNGKELWRVGGLNPMQNGFFRSIASPVISDGLIVAPYARGSSITAIKLGGSGDVTGTHIAWFKDDLGADVPTPAARNGRVYFCTDRGEIACLDAKSGKEIWRGQVEKHRTPFSASPILAGGHLYVAREDAKTFVLKAGDSYELVAHNELPGESMVATPVFVNGRILIRTFDNLYCIGK
jgi:outer membrane protein assembly factor BamB